MVIVIRFVCLIIFTFFCCQDSTLYLSEVFFSVVYCQAKSIFFAFVTQVIFIFPVNQIKVAISTLAEQQYDQQQGSHTLEISKFPTIFQLFRSSSQSISHFFQNVELFSWSFFSGFPTTLHKFNKFPT